MVVPFDCFFFQARTPIYSWCSLWSEWAPTRALVCQRAIFSIFLFPHWSANQIATLGMLSILLVYFPSRLRKESINEDIYKKSYSWWSQIIPKEILLDKNEDPLMTCKRDNCALQLLLKWNKIEDDDIPDYKRTLRMMIQKMQKKHGRKVINKIFPNGDTCLHTAGTTLLSKLAEMQKINCTKARVKRMGALPDAFCHRSKIPQFFIWKHGFAQFWSCQYWNGDAKPKVCRPCAMSHKIFWIVKVVSPTVYFCLVFQVQLCVKFIWNDRL